MKKIKSLSLTLAASLIFSAMPAYANTQYTDSTHEVIDIDTPISKDDNSNCDVYAEIGSEFKVTIPKHITLDGATKKGTYNISVEGDIAGKETIKVVPEEAVTLSSKDKADVIGTIAQDKTKWSYNEILSNNKILGNGLIDANKITAGAWNGTFNFNVSLTENSITVTAKNESGEDLNASSNLIEGEQRENLLNGLVESGLVNSAEDVDALIDVDSDDFDGLADTTFDVSSIAKEGDTVVIVHFDEEKQMWEHVATETVDSDGTISGNFSSYSPVGFIIIDSTGNQTVHTEHIDTNNDGFCDVCGKQGTIVYIYHEHTGSTTNNTGCYTAIDYYDLNCGKTTSTITGYNLGCGYSNGQATGSYLSCTQSTAQKLNCSATVHSHGSGCYKTTYGGHSNSLVSTTSTTCKYGGSSHSTTVKTYRCKYCRRQGAQFSCGHTNSIPSGTCYSNASSSLNCSITPHSHGSGCYTSHSHSGSCYTTTYHYHSGNSSSGGGCYNKAVYHSHSGNAINGGGCYGKVFYKVNCDKTEETIETQYTKFE